MVNKHLNIYRQIIILALVSLVVFNCNSDDEAMTVPAMVNLDELVSQNSIAQDSVIACASGSLNADEFIAYVYPRPGVTDLRYFETENTNIDEDDYANYQQIDLAEEDVFNGFLKSFTRQSEAEKWVIVTFMEDNVLNLSQPILIKHQSSNTLFADQVDIERSQRTSPLFDWAPLINTEDVIYFQVVSDGSNDLLSGTYTFESQFRYYDLSNVVLNITPGTPPDLIPDQSYGFLLMGVSDDNWVNTLLQTSFVVAP